MGSGERGAGSFGEGMMSRGILLAPSEGVTGSGSVGVEEFEFCAAAGILIWGRVGWDLIESALALVGVRPSTSQ